jgi:hypothetical protein
MEKLNGNQSCQKNRLKLYFEDKMIILLPVLKAEKVFYYFANREGVLLERRKRKGVWLTLTVYFI